MEPYIGEIRLFAGGFAPSGWAVCDGSLLQIRSNTTLYTLLGTTYGGDGQNTFGLPNLLGHVTVGAGNGPGLTPRPLASTGGAPTVTLNLNQLPGHNHAVSSGAPSDSLGPVNAVWGDAGRGVPAPYTNAAANVSLPSDTLQPIGGGQAHNNMQPYLPLTYMIATDGLFPPRG